MAQTLNTNETDGPVLMDAGVPFPMVPFSKEAAPTAAKIAKARSDIEDIAKLCGWN